MTDETGYVGILVVPNENESHFEYLNLIFDPYSVDSNSLWFHADMPDVRPKMGPKWIKRTIGLTLSKKGPWIQILLNDGSSGWTLEKNVKPITSSII